MNDLERDLHDLLERRARDVEPSPRAPEAVIRRGRRRQAGTVAGGTMAGFIAIAVAVAVVGSIDRTRGDTLGAPTETPTASPSSEHEGLKMRQTDTGAFVVYGRDLGHDWEIHRDDGVLRFFVDGIEDPGGSFSFSTGSSTAVDVDGGTFLIGVLDTDVTSWSVEVDGSQSQTIEGRSIPAQDVNRHPATLWLVALPGSGTGVSRGPSSLPLFVSWPATLYPDGLFGAGSDGVVSWGIAHHTDRCALVKVIGADPSDSGTSDCLPSWNELSRIGDASPLIGGFYGQRNATITLVLPDETPVSASGRTPDCFTVRVESNFANTEFCVFSLPVSETTTVAFGENGDAFGGPIGLRARPGAMDLIDPAPPTSP